MSLVLNIYILTEEGLPNALLTDVAITLLQPLGFYSFMLSPNHFVLGRKALTRTTQETSQTGDMRDDAREHTGPW